MMPATPERFAFQILFLCCFLFCHLAVYAGSLGEGAARLTSVNVAVVINMADPESVRVGEYYRVARSIPEENIIRVNLRQPTARLSVAEFEKLKTEIDGQLRPEHEVMVLAWTKPYAVECNAITTALTLGFDPDQCKSTCAPGKPNPYFDSPSRRPFEDYRMRLAMLLPSENFSSAKALIDRGVQSNAGVFRATAYYLETTDKNRSSRAPFFPPNGLLVPNTGLQVTTMKSNKLIDAKDIMIYQTGLPWVEGLETLNFLPGALADHLTSMGGVLDGKSQMSALRWLDAGATATYGTVSEPCNYWQKFPNPAVLFKWYATGSTAIEAYWKSVAWPAQGLILGEPLAAPYARR